MPADLTIAGRSIAAGADMFVIAELGLNHNGDTDLAVALVDAAAAAGASAVKLQVFDAARLIGPDAPAPAHLDGVSLRQLLRTFELAPPALRTIVSRARGLGLAVVVTAFDVDTLRDCVALGIDAIKVASGDLTHAALIDAAAGTRLPVISSTGMSTADEVAHAHEWMVGAGARVVAFLHCVSAYPTPDGQQNLRAIQTLAHTCRTPVGLSDHGMGRDAAVMAYTLGATLYERHLHLPGTGAIDAAVSSSPDELRDIVDAVARCRRALGDGTRQPMPCEVPNIHPSRRGLYATRALRPGDVVCASDVIALRPATGIGAQFQLALIGRRMARHLDAGACFEPTDLATDEPASDGRAT